MKKYMSVQPTLSAVLSVHHLQNAMDIISRGKDAIGVPYVVDHLFVDHIRYVPMRIFFPGIAM